MLQANLILPLAVDGRELLVGLDAIVINAEDLTLGAAGFQIRQFLIPVRRRARFGGIGRRGVRGMFKPIVLRGQRGDVSESVLARVFQKLKTGALVQPRAQPSGDSTLPLHRDKGDLPFFGRTQIVLAHGSFMRRQLLLDPAALISGSARQILLRIGQFIGIETELGFGKFEVIRDSRQIGTALRRWLARGCRRSERTHALRIILDHLLQLGHFLRERKRLAAKRPLLQAHLAQRGGKGLIHLMVGQPLGFPREVQLLRGGSRGSQKLRRFPGPQVHDVVRRGDGVFLRARGFQKGQVGHGIPRGPGERKAQNKHRQDRGRDNQPYPAELADTGSGTMKRIWGSWDHLPIVPSGTAALLFPAPAERVVDLH